MPRALIIGTSNSMIWGGVDTAIQQHFGAEHVSNISLGGTSGTFQALFAMIAGTDFRQFDAVFLDLMPNEQCYQDMPLDYWMAVARTTYSMLPQRPRYILMGFFQIDCFTAADSIERGHRALCDEFGVTFLSFREILLEICYRHALPLQAMFRPGDRIHLVPAVANYLISYVLERKLPTLATLHRPPTIGTENFFVHDVRPEAAAIVTRSTSWHTAEFGVFEAGVSLDLPEGQWLGFDFNRQGARATLSIHAEPRLAKYLSFVSEHPYTMPAPFFREIWVPPGGYVRIDRDPAESDPPFEWTDGAVGLEVPRDGHVELSRFYFSTRRISELLRMTGADRITPHHRPHSLGAELVASILADWPKFSALLA